MFMSDEPIYYDEFTMELQQLLENLRAEDLPQAMADAGELGELACIEADNREWKYTKEVSHEGGMTSVSISVTSRGDDEDEAED